MSLYKLIHKFKELAPLIYGLAAVFYTAIRRI
jgi:hypothetical protein